MEDEWKKREKKFSAYISQAVYGAIQKSAKAQGLKMNDIANEALELFVVQQGLVTLSKENSLETLIKAKTCTLQDFNKLCELLKSIVPKLYHNGLFNQELFSSILQRLVSVVKFVRIGVTAERMFEERLRFLELYFNLLKSLKSLGHFETLFKATDKMLNALPLANPITDVDQKDKVCLECLKAIKTFRYNEATKVPDEFLVQNLEFNLALFTFFNSALWDVMTERHKSLNNFLGKVYGKD